MEEYRVRIEQDKSTTLCSHTLEATPSLETERRTAYFLIMRASELLSGLGSEEERVSWMLEDCAELLNSPASPYSSKKIKNAT